MTPAPPSAFKAPVPPPAWPRSAQLATAALLALAAALLAVHALASWRGGSRPTDLRPGAAPLHPIDLNQAGRAELLQLPGVGAHLAASIEDQRRKQGGFRSVEDLRQVPGIGETTLERLRPWVCVRGEDAGGESEAPADLPPPPSRMKGTAPAVPAKSARLTAPVDVNRATAEELQKLPGIGPKLAQRILDERGRGRFKSVDDLRRVGGIGVKTLERLRPYVTVDGTPVKVAAAEEVVN
jgi:competence protein ComEA